MEPTKTESAMTEPLRVEETRRRVARMVENWWWIREVIRSCWRKTVNGKRKSWAGQLKWKWRKKVNSKGRR